MNPVDMYKEPLQVYMIKSDGRIYLYTKGVSYLDFLRSLDCKLMLPNRAKPFTDAEGSRVYIKAIPFF